MEHMDDVLKVAFVGEPAAKCLCSREMLSWRVPGRRIPIPGGDSDSHGVAHVRNPAQWLDLTRHFLIC